MFSPVAFDVNKTHITVEKVGERLKVFASRDRHLFRQQFRALKPGEFPLQGSIVYPNEHWVVCSFHYPWDPAGIINRVKEVLEGTPPQPAPQPAKLKKMRVPYSDDPTVSLVNAVAVLSLFNQPISKGETAALQFITTALRTDELALFHFLSNKLAKKTQILVARELRDRDAKILSEVRRRESVAFPKDAQMGITNDDDRDRGDRYYGFGYIAFPLVTNAARLNRISKGLSPTAVLQIDFPKAAKTVLLPCDLGDPHDHQFIFLRACDCHHSFLAPN